MSKVMIKTLQQKTFTIEIEHTETVKLLKEKIEEGHGDEFQASSMKLIYGGKIMDDTKPLTDYNIQPKGFVVAMAVKARAPPKPAATEEGASTTTAEQETTPTPAATTESNPPPSETTTTTTTASTESEDATRMETSEATPTAQGTDTTDSRGGDALQQAGSTLVTGDALDEVISNLMGLGFEREQVIRALNSSFNNPDRAAEMLMSGSIPDEPIPPAPASMEQGGSGEQPTRDVPPQAPQPVSAEGQPPAAPGGEGGNPLEFLRRMPQFQTLQQLIQQNPQALPSLLQQLGQQNPQLLQLISQHQQAFIDMLNQPPTAPGGAPGGAPAAPGGVPGAPGGGGPPAMSIQVTQEEKEAIDRLTALGFTEGEAIQAFFACEKNEELAANFLLSEPRNPDQ